jgi:predicted enzyme involved in methoxymalonyl-ACP biosynthesis
MRDRFGDNGLTGVLIAFEEGDCLRIDIWLISCRVLGRRAEEVMFGALMRYARNHGLRYIVGEYLPTAKNVQVMDLFDRLGFKRIEEAPNGERKYQLDLLEQTFEWPDYFKIEDHTQ